MKSTKEVEVSICDICGKEITDNQPRVYFVVHGPLDVDENENSVLYEYSQCGDYCPTCQQSLIDGILSSFIFPDNYLKEDRDTIYKIEKDLVEKNVKRNES